MRARVEAPRTGTRIAVAAPGPIETRGPASGQQAVPVEGFAPSAGWRASGVDTLRAELAMWDGAFETALTSIAEAIRLRPAELLHLALQSSGSANAQVLLTDVLVARAPELDPSAWKALRVRLATTQEPVVAENLIEALIALRPSLDERQARALKNELARPLPQATAGVTRRVGVLLELLASPVPHAPLPSRALATDVLAPMSPAEVAALASVETVLPEAVVNAKIPASMARQEAFAWGFLPKGQLAQAVPGTLVCDTGNALEPGVIDHHQLGVRTCATSLVLNKAELIVAHHQAAPITTLICHSSPDLDAVASVYFAGLLLSDGQLPKGASELAHYVSLEDNARLPVGSGDPTKHLATLCREAALRLAKDRHPCEAKDVPPDIQRARDEEVLNVVKGILGYVLAAGLPPTDERLFSALGSKDVDVLPSATRLDIEALQSIVADAEAGALEQLAKVRFGEGMLPRLDGKGVLPIRFALTDKGGKRLDAILREREGAAVVIIAPPEYTWTAAEPTSGASLRPIAAGYEAWERQKARAANMDRLPTAGERIQPGWSVKNPYYIGGTDSFIITPRGAQLTTDERREVIRVVAGVTWGSS